MAERKPARKPLEARCRIWLERGGQAVFGDGRAELLEAVGKTGSLSRAAAELKMSYRSAWDHLRKMERGLKLKLVERKTGGAAGGGTRLTPDGRRLLERFRALRAGMDATLERQGRRFIRELKGR